MVDRRQALAGELRERRGFVPAHATHRHVALSGGIGTGFPCRGAWPSCAIDKPRDGSVERQLAIGRSNEGVLPVLPVGIAIGVYEGLVLAIADLEPVDAVVGERERRGTIGPDQESARVSAGNPRHLRVRCADRVECQAHRRQVAEVDQPPIGVEQAVHRAVAGLLEPI